MSNRSDYQEQALAHLEYLCGIKPNRRTGSAGNREAASYLAARFQDLGYEVDQTPFEALDYQSAGALLSGLAEDVGIHTSPYSPGCDVTAELIRVSSLEELEAADAAGKVLLLQGEICAEQLMPKNFVFYNPDQHRKIITALEEKRPAALITATSDSPGAAGALSPFPLIMDGDFEIPSAYCSETAGRQIAESLGREVRLEIRSQRQPARASNVIASRPGKSARKIALMAHFDTYEDTPGAVDNASGVIILLLAAELLAREQPALSLEIIAFNGEDHYSAGGQMDYLRRYGEDLPKIELAVNVDGAAYRGGKTAYSFYGCSPEREAEVRRVFQEYHHLEGGETWYSGDHMIFVQNQIPCLALTSSLMPELLTTVIHTEQDLPELVSPEQLVEAASALADLVGTLS
jgi:aminopeptidase YwaD